LINDTSAVDLTMDGERAVLRHSLPGGAAAPRQSAEFIVAGWVRAGRAVTGIEWTPVEVRFAHASPPDATEHAAFFRAPVRFAMGENALELDRSLLALPCIRPEPALVGVLDRYAADRLEKVPLVASLADRVRLVLEEDLRDGEPAAKHVASRLRMSVRTLTRQLADEHTSFRQILDRLRHTLAARHLAAGELAIGEVAFVLGFSELSSFHRAFKRWTGTSPAEFRQRHRLNRP
jgi:AraC-like DNA-binding protein